MQYKRGVPRNLCEIGQQLGVAELPEGTMQRANKRVSVNAQLINARTDAHLWAHSYGRDLADVFAIKAKSPRRSPISFRQTFAKEIDKLPTSNLAAFDLNVRANTLIARSTDSTEVVAQLKGAL
jgi:hypothetical protein